MIQKVAIIISIVFLTVTPTFRSRLISSLVGLAHNCPKASADLNHCLILLQICDIDTITPAGAAQETETRLGKAATLNRATDS